MWAAAPVVGGGHGEGGASGPSGRERPEQGYPQGSALRRVRARAHLVQQHQRLPVSLPPQRLRSPPQYSQRPP